MKLIAVAILSALVSSKRLNNHQELAQTQSRFIAEPAELPSIETQAET